MTREPVTRFSISMPAPLAERLDAMVADRGFGNRSQAIADMVRRELVEHDARTGSAEIAGTITLVYNHHRPNVQRDLTRLQHDHLRWIVSTLHVHLDHDDCLEVLVVRGPAQGVRALADGLISAKGVKHGRLTVTTTGDTLP